MILRTCVDSSWHFTLSVSCAADRSLSAGWIGLVGRRGPRSKQPFMVTFFRESQVPCRPPRATRPQPRRKKPKYDLPVPSIHSWVSELPLTKRIGSVPPWVCGTLMSFRHLDMVLLFIKGVSVSRLDHTPVNNGQPCKKHELYVSFNDLGWKVRHCFKMIQPLLHVTFVTLP